MAILPTSFCLCCTLKLLLELWFLKSGCHCTATHSNLFTYTALFLPSRGQFTTQGIAQILAGFPLLYEPYKNGHIPYSIFYLVDGTVAGLVLCGRIYAMYELRWRALRSWVIISVCPNRLLVIFVLISLVLILGCSMRHPMR